MNSLAFFPSSVPRRGALALLTFAASSGCSTELPDRPPSQSSDVPAFGFPGSMGGAAGQEPEEPSDEVTAQFYAYSDDLFLSVAPYTQRSNLFVLDEDGADGESLPYDGVHFSTDELRRAKQVWILVRPTTNAEMFPTWSAQDTTKSELAFELFPKVLLSDLLGSLSTPLDLNPETAQVLLRTVDEDGKPLSGVRIQGSLAGSALYTVSGSWADWPSETDDSGMILLSNLLVTEKLPGTWLRVELAHNGQKSVELPALAGAVTEVNVVFD